MIYVIGIVLIVLLILILNELIDIREQLENIDKLFDVCKKTLYVSENIEDELKHIDNSISRIKYS